MGVLRQGRDDAAAPPPPPPPPPHSQGPETKTEAERGGDGVGWGCEAAWELRGVSLRGAGRMERTSARAPLASKGAGAWPPPLLGDCGAKGWRGAGGIAVPLLWAPRPLFREEVCVCYRELNLMKGRVGAEKKKREEKRESNEESRNLRSRNPRAALRSTAGRAQTAAAPTNFLAVV